MSRVEIGAEARMRDGVVLRADVHRPDVPGSYPVLLMRTPYGRTHGQSESGYHHPSWFADRGYVVVIQDCRGRWGSDGDFVPFLDEAQDGYDTIEWAAALPEANGRVGMYGYSYPGLVQLLAATQRPPSLQAICPGFTSSQAYDGWIYSHGAVFLGWALTWALFLAHDTARRQQDDDLLRSVRSALLGVTDGYWTLPLDDLPVQRADALPTYYREWLEHPTHDEYWRRWSIDEDYGRITVPALHFTGWYDGFLRGTVDNYVGHARRRPRGAAADDLALDARAVGAGLGRRGIGPRLHERRRRPSRVVRSPPQGFRARRGGAAHPRVHAPRRLARLPGVAAAGRAHARAVPPLRGQRELQVRRRPPLHRPSRRGAPGRVHVRPGPADMERRGPLMLRRLGDTDGSGLPGGGRGDEVGARLHL